MTRAQTNMAIGATILVIGAGITAATYSAAQGGGVYIVAYGAIAAGAWQFLRGLIQWIGESSSSPQDSSADAAKTSLMLAVHAMAYMASGDGTITAKERATIDQVLKRLTGQGLPADIGNGLEKMASVAPNDDDLYRQARLLLPQDAKELVFKCTLLVGLADGEAANSGLERLTSVGTALGLASERQAQLVADMVSMPATGTQASA